MPVQRLRNISMGVTVCQTIRSLIDISTHSQSGDFVLPLQAYGDVILVLENASKQHVSLPHS